MRGLELTGNYANDWFQRSDNHMAFMLIEEGNQVSGTLCCVSRLFRDGAP